MVYNKMQEMNHCKSKLILYYVAIRQFLVLGGLLDCTEDTDDKRFGSTDQRVQDRDDIKVVLDGCFIKKTTQEWLTALEGSGMPYGPINSIEDCFKHPQVDVRDMIDAMEFEATVNRQLKMVGVPVKFGDSKATIRRRPPLLEKHTEEILMEAANGIENIR